MPKLSVRRQGIYAFIRSYCLQNGRAPSLREIGESVGLTSSSTVHSHCQALTRLGLLSSSRGKVRSYVPVDLGSVNDPLMRFLLLYVRKYPQCEITAQLRADFGDLLSLHPMEEECVDCGEPCHADRRHCDSCQEAYDEGGKGA